MSASPSARRSPSPHAAHATQSQSVVEGFRELFLDATSPAMRQCLAMIDRFAPHNDVLHLEGETGCGKSELFKQIVRCSSRRDRPTSSIVISGLDDERIASDLFGHTRGAYTGAVNARSGRLLQAAGGTLFLDEIGKATPLVQRQLLDFVETRRFYPMGSDRAVEVDCRIVTASNVPLNELVRTDGFLTDLRFRLQTFVVRVPTLRERAEDIPAIAAYLVARRAKLDPVLRQPPRLHAELLALLQSYRWPGNLRQFSACITRLCVEHSGVEELTPAHLTSQRELLTEAAPPAEPTVNGAADDEVTTRAARTVLARNAGNIAKTARELGIHRSTLYRRLRPDAGIQPA